MPHLLTIETDDYELTLWVRRLEGRREIYTNTLKNRGIAEIPPQEVIHTSSPHLKVILINEETGEEELREESTKKFYLPQPFFLENLQYQAEWSFKNEVSEARVGHRITKVCEAFRQVKDRNGHVVRLSGAFQTGNDIGWMRLPLTYITGGKEKETMISFEVLSTKMNLHSDLPEMYQMIDKQYPLWRFSLAEKTAQGASKDTERGDFPIHWLANFNTLREKLESGLKVISESPHRKLEAVTIFSRADRLKGKIPHKRAEEIKEDFKHGIKEKRYQVERKSLSLDTHENRFIKMVVTQTKKRLNLFQSKLKKEQSSPDKQRLSESFWEEMEKWEKPLLQMERRSFLKDVGSYRETPKESLVLQQKAGYSAVYKVWQELKFYLTLFDNQTTVSMKSIAEIYEVWCFLSLKRILEDDLGFQEQYAKQSTLRENSYLGYDLVNGDGGCFEFKREDGLIISLKHEPKFRKNSENIRSYLAPQVPDILLTVKFPNDKEVILLFDAKYRIKETDQYDEETDGDKVPEDALNQMHRYRDALIHLSRERGQISKSRPVFGAYALYPGFHDQGSGENYYAEPIKEVGIGAFPLLPHTGGNHWLKEFLKEQLGKNAFTYKTEEIQEGMHLQEAARIPTYGMQQTLYQDLVMTAPVYYGERSKEYRDNFKNGTAKWYHTRRSTFEKKARNHLPNEVRYLALATEDEGQTKRIDFIWTVEEARVVKADTLTAQQTGKEERGSTDEYILFKLGSSRKLERPISGMPKRGGTVNMVCFLEYDTLTTCRVFTDCKNTAVYKNRIH